MSFSVASNSHADLLDGSPYAAYAYAYPHKTAYRELQPQPWLSDLWKDESQKALFLYLHIPFCEFRCGFCNLFTLSQPDESLPARYIEALRRQAVAVRESVPEARFARLAIGGGTPTFLTIEELKEVFGILHDIMDVATTSIPLGCEASPATVSLEKLQYLKSQGVDRLSIGVQSFDDQDCGGIGRPQKSKDVIRALDSIGEIGFPTLNLDLIYGGERQTMDSWIATVEIALKFRPEELYLYPLYVRPQTGIGRLQHQWDDWRLKAYREARSLLIDRGYSQVSMRMFRASHAPKLGGPVYCCQQDGMIGLGCGARSYTQRVHYGSDYAVRNSAIEGIIGRYVSQSDAEFRSAELGFELNDNEQRRRHLIMSLLQVDGVSLADYTNRFGTELNSDFPQLRELEERGFLVQEATRVVLTPEGIERSDAIGPWLFSPQVNELMEQYRWE